VRDAPPLLCGFHRFLHPFKRLPPQNISGSEQTLGGPPTIFLPAGGASAGVAAPPPPLGAFFFFLPFCFRKLAGLRDARGSWPVDPPLLFLPVESSTGENPTLMPMMHLCLTATPGLLSPNTFLFGPDTSPSRLAAFRPYLPPTLLLPLAVPGQNGDAGRWRLGSKRCLVIDFSDLSKCSMSKTWPLLQVPR